jgi:hypothetical protein
MKTSYTYAGMAPHFLTLSLVPFTFQQYYYWERKIGYLSERMVLHLKGVNTGHPVHSYPSLKYSANNVQKFLTEILGRVKLWEEIYGFVDVI